MSGSDQHTGWYCRGKFLDKERLNNRQAKKLNSKNNEAYSEFIIATLQDQVFSPQEVSPTMSLTRAVVVYKGV
jgi:hypothetical protein